MRWVVLAVMLAAGAAGAAEWPPGADADTPLYTLRRAPSAAAAWDLQFVPAPEVPGESCVEGQLAWDGDLLWTCVPGGSWVSQRAVLLEE